MGKGAKYRIYLLNLLVPSVVFGTVAGGATAVVVMVYKLCAHHIIGLAETGYHYLAGHLYWLPAVVVLLLGLAWLLDAIYRRTPNLRGGGIPTSIGVLRGLLTFRWLRNLVGIFFLSLSSFLLGVPLGNEGPAVQMGTAIGQGVVAPFSKKHGAWSRYSMTGGACAGFAVATGAPISGILLGIEEAHQRISPMIFIVSATAVAASQLVTELLAPLLGVSTSLFPHINLPDLRAADIWIPVAVGVTIGLFAVLFLRYYGVVNRFFRRTLARVPAPVKLFGVLVLVVVLGTISFSFVSTGHELLLSLFEGNTALWMLLLLLAVRATGTLCSNVNGITGGIFLPILAIGGLVASLLGKGADALLGPDEARYTAILVLGITACISGMMKMPLTAVAFSVEALSGHGNILFVVIAATVSFAITEIFGEESINDSVLETRLAEANHGRKAKAIDAFVTVQPGAFAVGKEIRDIFWPAHLFVLSVQHALGDEAETVGLREGDVLHVRYSTHHDEQTRAELTAIVGEQEYTASESDVL